MILIPKQELDTLLKTMSQEDFDKYLYEKLKSKEIPYPYSEDDFDFNITKQAFKDLLAYHNRPLEYLENFKVSGEYRYPISHNLIPERIGFTQTSNYFHKLNRLKAEKKGKSPFSVFEECNFSKERIRFITKTCDISKGLTSETFDDFFRLRGLLCQQFKPIIAKYLYDFFKAQNVLDLSAGWGDRLAGFFASNAKTYIGIDPNPRLHPDYQRQIEFYSNILKGTLGLEETVKNVRMIQSGSEDVDYKSLDTVFDVIFTSPPYFNVERYNSDDPNQCYSKYNTVDLWFEKYLYPTLEKSWEVLKENGFMAINIADNQSVCVCDRMNDFISTLPKAKYIGTLNMPIQSKYFTTEDKEKSLIQKIEPIWVFQKTENPISLEVQKPLEIVNTLEDW